MRPALFLLLAAVLTGTPAAAQKRPPTAVSLRAFGSDAALLRYVREIAAARERAFRDGQHRRGCSIAFKVSRAKASNGRTVIAGLVLGAHGPLQGAMVSAGTVRAGSLTDVKGRYRVVLGGDSLRKKQRIPVWARAIGYDAVRDSLVVSPGDSLETRVALCASVMTLDEVVVSSAAETGGITNNQHAGVDEGGIAKLHGDHLVILRRGRLFTVSLRDNTLTPVATVDPFPAGLRADWYDELLVYGDKVVVIGYSYARGGTELNVFRIDDAGGLEYQDTWQLRSADYYSSRNYAARLVGNRLVFYTPHFLGWRHADPLAVLPAMRRWGPSGDKGSFETLVTPGTVYRPSWTPRPDEQVVLHSVTSCDLAARSLRCEATAVIGGVGHNFYVSPTAVYVWTGHRTAAVVVRMPLDGSRPGALGVAGSPPDQFSFLERDGWLNVLVRAGGAGEWMWRAEASSGDLALLRVPVRSFLDGSGSARAGQFRALPRADGVLHNRFVGNYLLYGAGNGWFDGRADSASLVVVPAAGGSIASIDLPHGVDRIEPMGARAVVVGARNTDLRFTGITLDGAPAPSQSFVLPQASQGELRSHGFFYRTDSADAGIIGLPFRGAREGGWSHLFRGSAGVFFLENTGRAFRDLGSLDARDDSLATDKCTVSCVDWYGNARPLFIGGRVFALMGYELVEGRVADQRIREVRRISFLR